MFVTNDTCVLLSGPTSHTLDYNRNYQGWVVGGGRAHRGGYSSHKIWPSEQLSQFDHAWRFSSSQAAEEAARQCKTRGRKREGGGAEPKSGQIEAASIGAGNNF